MYVCSWWYNSWWTFCDTNFSCRSVGSKSVKVQLCTAETPWLANRQRTNVTGPLSRRSWGGTRNGPKKVCMGGYAPCWWILCWGTKPPRSRFLFKIFFSFPDRPTQNQKTHSATKGDGLSTGNCSEPPEFSCRDIWLRGDVNFGYVTRELKHARFWVTDGNGKWDISYYNLP